MPDVRYDAFRLSLGLPATEERLEGLNKLLLCLATVSVGDSPEHTLPERIEAIASAGFQAIELSCPDLVTFASQRLRLSKRGDGVEVIEEDDFDSLCSAATAPFPNLEGWPKGSPERKAAWGRVEGCVRIMEAAGTEILLVGSSDSPEDKIGKDRSRFVQDLRELADMLAAKNFRVAYENRCWSSHAPDWEDVWDKRKQVDRPNFGLCLNTFHSAVGEWADPTTASGLVEHRRSREEVELYWKSSCERLSRTIPSEKIYLLQISDAYRPKVPFEDKVVGGLGPRARWSHELRSLPLEGYLPVVDFAKAVLKTGFRGWVSHEVPDRRPERMGEDFGMTRLGRPWIARRDWQRSVGDDETRNIRLAIIMSSRERCYHAAGT